jgi:hypothetical protein
MPIEKQPSIETPQQEISHEALLNIELPENFVYEGKGVKSWKDTYDLDKLAYINSAGIELPKEWELDRPMLITSFIVLQRFAAFKECQRDGRDTKKFYEIMMADLLEHRIDRIGRRDHLPKEGKSTEVGLNNKVTYVDYVLGVNGSSNVPQKVKPEEFEEICNFLVQELTE